MKKIKRIWGQPLNQIQIDRTSSRIDKIKIYKDEISTSNQDIDDITWNDLEMDDVFANIDFASSYAGEQILYRQLHSIDHTKDWIAFEKQLSFLEENVEFRTKLQNKLQSIGKRDEEYYLPMFLKHPEEWRIGNSIIYHILQIMLIGFLISWAITDNIIFCILFFTVAIINLIIYIMASNKYEMLLYSLGSFCKILNLSDFICKNKKWSEVYPVDKYESVIKNLKKSTRFVGMLQSRQSFKYSGMPEGIIFDYLFGITLYDVSFFNHLMKIFENKKDQVLMVYQMVGEIDAMLSVLEYRASLQGDYCQPVLNPDGDITADAVRHPLIPGAVANDFNTNGCSIITGANATGKSTFMKSIALNLIFAQTIHTCTAQKFVMPGVRVMTSMSIRDNIKDGESYYIKEIKYLKRMLSETENSKLKPFLIVDEILKGTNTRERIAASEAVLKYLANKNCFVLVATHDTELVELLREKYASYYFNCQIEDNEVSFDYKIHEGFEKHTNAIELLKIYRFPDEIIAEAQRFKN